MFRYPGQSSRIKFGDLRSLLEERDRRAQLALVGAAGKIAERGADNVLILDTDKNVLEAKGHSILIDQQLAETLKFIKEGQFDERRGAPVLKLVGEVSPVSVKGAVTAKIAHAAIFQENILDTFLEQTRVDNPIQYIYAGLAQSRLWLPIFYFVRLSGNSNEEVVDLVRSLRVSQKGKKILLVERLLGKRSAFTKSVTQASAKVRDEITAGAISVPDALEDVAVFCQGVTAVSNTPVEPKRLLMVV